jgi:hypothetical protein
MMLGYFLSLSWKYPDVNRMVPGLLEISSCESGFFQGCWKFPVVSQDFSSIVGNFQ